MRRSRIPKAKQERLIEYFVSGSSARCAAELVGVHRNTAAYYFQRLRELIAIQTEQETNQIFDGMIEIDECYFDGPCTRDHQGKDFRDMGAVFGLLKHEGKIYTKMFPELSGNSPSPIIGKKIIPDGIIYSDRWNEYSAFSISDFKHQRINRSTFSTDRKNQINGIENFWSQTKRRLLKFNGIPKDNFGLFLKECEWRFNTPSPKQQLTQLRQWVDWYYI